MTVYHVAWDNGASACGTFPQKFFTYEAAEAYGNEWVAEMNQPEDSPEHYTFEIIEEEE